MRFVILWYWPTFWATLYSEVIVIRYRTHFLFYVVSQCCFIIVGHDQVARSFKNKLTVFCLIWDGGFMILDHSDKVLNNLVCTAVSNFAVVCRRMGIAFLRNKQNFGELHSDDTQYVF